MTNFKEAEAFKGMLIEASSQMLAPHVEGVFSVFERNYKPESEWVDFDEEKILKGKEYYFQLESGQCGIGELETCDEYVWFDFRGVKLPLSSWASKPVRYAELPEAPTKESK